MVTSAMAAAVREAAGATGVAAILAEAARACVALTRFVPKFRYRDAAPTRSVPIGTDQDTARLVDVVRLYLLVLRTVPDRPGLRHHADLLNSGSTLDELAESLLSVSGIDHLDRREAALGLWSRAGGADGAFESAWRQAGDLPSFVVSLVRQPPRWDAYSSLDLFRGGIDPEDHEVGPAWGYRLWASEIDARLMRLAGSVSLLLRILGPRIVLTLHLNRQTTARQLDATLAGLSRQIYGRWRLVLDGECPSGWAMPRDPRIVAPAGIVPDDGPRELRGELRAGDVLSPACLSLFGLASLRHPFLRRWRCDEDQIDQNGLRSRPRLQRDAGLLLRRGSAGAAGAAVRHLPAVLLHRDGSALPVRPSAERTSVHLLPAVSLVIVTRDRPALLHRCIDSIRATTGELPPEIVIVDNGTTDRDALAILAGCAADGCTVLRRPGPFNWSALCNAGVRASAGEVVVLLNNDVACIEPGWLSALASACRDPAVGVVGATLLFEDGRVQHAGVLLGPGAVAVHRLVVPDADCSGSRLESAVTGACMAMRRDVFDQLGGFEEALPVTWNDLDFCLRARQAGLDVRLASGCVLRHDELGTRTPDDAPENRAQMARTLAFVRRRHRLALRYDRCLHPFLLVAGGGRYLDPAAPARVGRSLFRRGRD